MRLVPFRSAPVAIVTVFLVEPVTALLADPIFREHLAGREHPERPERFDAVVRGLRQAGLLDRLARVNQRTATAPTPRSSSSARTSGRCTPGRDAPMRPARARALGLP